MSRDADVTSKTRLDFIFWSCDVWSHSYPPSISNLDGVGALALDCLWRCHMNPMVLEPPLGSTLGEYVKFVNHDIV